MTRRFRLPFTLVTLTLGGLVAGLLSTVGGSPAGPVAPFTMDPNAYPASRVVDVIDDYHGTRVADPYRWLEDDLSPETAAWVDAQNALTRRRLDTPVRARLRARLATLRNYPRTGAPERHGTRYVFTRNTGLQDQDVLYVQDGAAGAPRVLLDPNVLSDDGTAALTTTAFNDDGTLMAYAVSRSGSDRQDVGIRDVVTGRDLPDRLQWIKFASIAWTKDGAGFYYTRFPEPGTVPVEDEQYFPKVYFHRLGEAQSRDTLVYERPDDRELVFAIDLALDDRYLVVTVFKGASDKSEVVLLDRRAAGATPVTLFAGFDSSWMYADDLDGRLYFQTDHAAPLGRIVAVTLPDLVRAAPSSVAGPMRVAGAVVTDVVAEQADRLSWIAVVNQQIVALYLVNASDRVRLFAADGSTRGEIALPALGTVTALTGRPEHDELFLSFASFTYPPTPFRYDFGTGRLTPFAETPSTIDPSAYVVEQVWYPSKDRTRVSMFLVHRKDLVRDGARPTLLYGYGGFNVSETPRFDPSIFVLLDEGGVYALANIRGGGEYGEAWHKAGMLDRKQNVFDDFIAAAEWLTANGYASPAQLAIEGGSNGGLLVGAVLVQRPDLVGAVVCRVPVADMLRYHLFTVGRFWIPEYGSADDPAQFPFLYAYSPYHHVRPGVVYPPTLVMTADTDDRVAPGMAKKFAARLQQANGGRSPILIRVETKAGHGAGKPVSKVIDEDADIYSFLFQALGVSPRST